jgi:3-oxoacyl-[acyl-carrier protein] reductase
VVIVITGTRKGIGRQLAEYYLGGKHIVAGCSREPSDLRHADYTHYCLDVTDEARVKAMVAETRRTHGGIDALINNAGIAAMNHVLLTPAATVDNVMRTNVLGTFLFSREVAKVMQLKRQGRIVNFTTVATPLNLEGEAAYAASKAAVISLTKIMSGELAAYGITVNAIGPTPFKSDLIRSVPEDKLNQLLARQAIPRFATIDDIANVIDFFLAPASDFITGQVIYLGGV